MKSPAGTAKFAVRCILVAIKDPAARELPSVTKAAQLARALGAELLLFQALPADATGQLRRAALAALERLAAQLRRKHARTAVAAQWDAPAAAAVIRVARQAGADLIVAEQHSGWRLGLLHQNDRELLRRSPVPVLLVKRAGAYRQPVVLAAVDPDHTFSKPEQLDEEILRVGAAVAKSLRGALHAVHAYLALPVTAFPRGAPSQHAVERVQSRSAKAAREKLARAVRSTGIPPARRHIIARHPTDAIEEAAADTRSSIVVMGAVARSGLKRLLIGDTAEKVLSHIACDVLVVKKPQGVARRIPRASRRDAGVAGSAARLAGG